MVYRGAAERVLKKAGVHVGDTVAVKTKKDEYRGILMPRTEAGDDNHIVVKLDNGYNVGVKITGNEKITKTAGKKAVSGAKTRLKHDPKKKTLSILHTGGTIASKVDYRTGGVVPAFSPEEIIELFPELGEIANINARMVSNVLSGNIEFDHIALMAEAVKKEIKKGTDGIVMPHGTDTLHVSSAGLSFMAQNLPVPVIFVGAQRSSDRGSSDAKMNLMCASQFAVKSDFSGVGLCMHASMSDDDSFIHEGTKVRKMHTSRRDAFRSINQEPWARVWQDGNIEYLRKDYPKRNKDAKPVFRTEFEKKVALVKGFSGMRSDMIDFLAEKKYKGIVFEGTGLGHLPVNVLDDYTKNHAAMLKSIKNFVDSGGVAVMTSSCINGRVNMNVYSYGRDLLNAGVIPGEDMTPETAHAKLKWVLGQTKKPEEAKKMMLTNIAGEITERTSSKGFPDE